jgi:putative membrane protein
MWWHGDMTWWGWLAMTISMLVFWALVIVGVVWAIRSIQTGNTTSQVDARDVLRERFARGEIDEEHFLRAMNALHDADHGPPTGRSTGGEPPEPTR